MNEQDKQHAVRTLCRAALIASQDWQPEDRADVYEGIFIACDGLDLELAKTARDAGRAIRDSIALQLTFASLLNLPVNAGGES